MPQLQWLNRLADLLNQRRRGERHCDPPDGLK